VAWRGVLPLTQTRPFTALSTLVCCVRGLPEGFLTLWRGEQTPLHIDTSVLCHVAPCDVAKAYPHLALKPGVEEDIPEPETLTEEEAREEELEQEAEEALLGFEKHDDDKPDQGQLGRKRRDAGKLDAKWQAEKKKGDEDAAEAAQAADALVTVGLVCFRSPHHVTQHFVWKIL